ncbi:MAG: hypothetical protein IKZ21_02440 [Clostridia bacterium]|nr:hypothetical protein [Clostridia bacterium]
MPKTIPYLARVITPDRILDLPLQVEREENENALTLTLPAGDVPTDFIEITLLPDLFTRHIGDLGNYILPRSGSGAVTRFTSKPEGMEEFDAAFLPIIGLSEPKGGLLLIFEGMHHGGHFRLSLKENLYTLAPVIQSAYSSLFEDISVKLYFLTESQATYPAMASLYRNYKLQRGDIRMLAHKAAERPLLHYLAESPEIRIRMGWKPAPPRILTQTRANEPEMRVACTFDRVGELLDELHARGLEKAEFCLVGWNKSGHDGRWPETFPVEPLLGGEDGLRRLIQKAESYGYKMVCHTNSLDCYEIAEDFSEDITSKQPDGTPYTCGRWSGGQAYQLCPTKAMDYARRDLPKIRDLGFSGSHYIDVISTVAPRDCHDPHHPVNRGECVKLWNDILSYAADLFGGISSEGTYDFTCGILDYGLYSTFKLLSGLSPLEDDFIPLWQLCYHGVLTYNPSADTVNYPIKPPSARLRFYEYGGRPSLYLYSAFMENNHWMGDEDLVLDSDADLQRTVDVILQMTDEFAPMAHLQYVPMIDHKLLPNGLTEVTYQTGDSLLLNYTDAAIDGVPAGDFVYRRVKS